MITAEIVILFFYILTFIISYASQYAFNPSVPLLAPYNFLLISYPQTATKL